MNTKRISSYTVKQTSELVKKFSIIIPTLNEENTIQTCLQALQVMRQQAELIVVDGGSTDLTCQIAQPLADFIIHSEKGRAKQMNAGAKQAVGHSFIFLHADTLLPQNGLELIEHNQLAWGRFDIQLIGKPIMLKAVSFFMNHRSRLTGIATGDQAIFVHRNLFFQAGGFPEIALMEDISLCCTLKKYMQPNCLKTKVISSGRRWEQYGIVKTILLMWTLRLRYFFGENPEILSTLYSKGQFWKQ